MDTTNTNDDVKKQSEVTNQQKSPFTSSTSLVNCESTNDFSNFVLNLIFFRSRKVR